MDASSIGTPDSAPGRPSIVVVGAATRDIASDDPRGWRMGGGVTYSAVAAAGLGLRVRALIGVDAAAATARELDTLREAGVEVVPVPLESGPIFDNRRTPAGRQQFARAASDQLPAAALPGAWRTADAALLASVAGELGDDWAEAFAASTFVGLSAQGLVRRLVAGAEVERLAFDRGPLTARANSIALSREDVANGAPPIRDLLQPGQQLLVTHGKRGSLVLARTGAGIRGRFMPPLPLRRAVDPTGAGDTFVAAWLAARLLVGDGWRAHAIASLMGSLATQGRSLAEMPTAADACRILQEITAARR